MPGGGQNFKPETAFIHLFKYAMSLLKFKSYIKVKNIKHYLVFCMYFEMFEILASDHLLLFLIISLLRGLEGKTNSAEILSLECYFRNFSIDR